MGIKEIFINGIKQWCIYGLLIITSPVYALLVNPPQDTTVATSEDVEYNITVTATTLNNLNIINNTLSNQIYNINVLNNGYMENTTFLRDVIVIQGALSHDVFVTVENGGRISRISATEEAIDDDSTSTGTVRLTVDSGGDVVGRFNGSVFRTSNEIINAGNIEGDHQDLTLVENSGTMSGGALNNVTTVNNTGDMQLDIFLNENGVVNNNGPGVITGGIFGNTNTELNIGPSIANNFVTVDDISGVSSITISDSSSLTVSSATTVSGFTTMSGLGSLNINSGGTVEIDAANALAISGPINNSGTLVVNNIFNTTTPSSFTNSNGIVTVAGSGEIIGNISATGTSTFNVGDFSPTNFATQGTIDGFETININSNATFRVNNTISNVSTITANTATLDLRADILLLPAGTFANIIDNTTVTGNISLGAGSYGCLQGTQNFTITNNAVYDSITTSGDIFLQDHTINVTSAFTGSGTWNILTGASITNNGTVVVNPPADTAFNTWSYDFLDSGPSASLVLTSISNGGGFLFQATSEFNAEVLAVLNQMSINITNSGQQQLIDSFRSYTDQTSFNGGLQQLIPNINASAPNIMLQNDIFNRVETRIAALNNPHAQIMGMAAGDLEPNAAMWIGGFGSIATQQAIDENPGYDSNSYGILVGMDKLMRNYGVFGFGIGFSRNVIQEKSNPNFTTGVNGYHVISYSNHYFECDKFLESLATLALTNYAGSRAININSTIMSTDSNYNGAQGAVRFNYGKNYAFNKIFDFSPLATIQYALWYSPDYDETYSPAALHVVPKNFQNVLTLGGGVRLSAPPDEWLLGTREIRAQVTYDVISSDNLTTANFLVGSSNFSVATTPQRLALKLGIDFSFNLMECAQLSLQYDFELRNKYTDHSGTLKLRYLF